MEGIIRTAICFMCHDGKGNYLLQWRSKNCRDEQDRWDCGGGGLKFGEKAEDAVRREVTEEYGTSPVKAEFLGYRDVLREQNGTLTHWVTLDFRVELDSKKVTIGEPHKVDKLRWVTIPELLIISEPVHSQLFSTIEKNKNFLV
jgi:8-oxo-dGTP diphosphatase